MSAYELFRCGGLQALERLASRKATDAPQSAPALPLAAPPPHTHGAPPRLPGRAVCPSAATRSSFGPRCWWGSSRRPRCVGEGGRHEGFGRSAQCQAGRAQHSGERGGARGWAVGPVHGPGRNIRRGATRGRCGQLRCSCRVATCGCCAARPVMARVLQELSAAAVLETLYFYVSAALAHPRSRARCSVRPLGSAQQQQQSSLAAGHSPYGLPACRCL
jgi:hypothetical protein